MGTVLKIAAGIVLGSILLFFLRAAVISYAFDSAMKEMNNTIAKQHQQMQERLHQQRIARIEDSRREKQLQAMEAQKQRRAQALAWKKEQAWFNWYKEPDGCSSWQSESHMVRCINDKMRAQHEFDRLWSQGQIKVQ